MKNRDQPGPTGTNRDQPGSPGDQEKLGVISEKRNSTDNTMETGNGKFYYPEKRKLKVRKFKSGQKKLKAE